MCGCTFAGFDLVIWISREVLDCCEVLLAFVLALVFV